ncbi:MAG: AI-2E family transporter [Acidobacteriaceae bacterium]
MQSREWIGTASHGLKQWFIAQCYDSLLVGAMWAVGLLILRVPLAPLWAVLGAAFQFVPSFGPILSLVGPVLAIALSGGGWMKLLWLLVVYAVIAVVDGLLLQPYLMRRAARVPFWASLLTPIVLGIVIPFWGVLLAAPLLAVVYTFRNRQ